MIQLDDLEFENGELVKVKGVLITDLSGLSVQDLIEIVHDLAQLAKRQRAPWEQRLFFPIVMPLDENGCGPASVESGRVSRITWEVWDQYLVATHGSYDFLNQAVMRAEELNDKYGQCIDEGCPEYGTPHTHLKNC